jgi:hypothetical protein
MKFSAYRRNAKRKGSERKAQKRKKRLQDGKEKDLKYKTKQQEMVDTAVQKITDVSDLVTKFANLIFVAFSDEGGELLLVTLGHAIRDKANKHLIAMNRKALLDDNWLLYLYTNLCLLDVSFRKNFTKIEVIVPMVTLLQACFISYDEWTDAVIEGSRNGISADTFDYITNDRDFDEEFHETNLLQKLAARITGEEIHIFMPDSWSERLVDGLDLTLVDLILPLGRAMGLEDPQIMHLLRFSKGTVERYLAG